MTPAQNLKSNYNLKKNNYSMFNLFDLHNSKKDTNLRQCLRVYGVIPWYLDEPKEEMLEAYKQAIELHTWFKKINKKLNKKLGLGWKREWAKIIPYSVSGSAIKDWVTCRASPPLIAIEKLKELGCEKEVEEIVSKIKYISSTTRDIIKIPNEPTQDIMYLAGLILGDGCLPESRRYSEGNFEYKFNICGGDKEFFVDKIIPLIEKDFEVRNILLYYHNQAWNIDKKSKAIFRFFTRIIGLPSGKKSIKAHVPKWVKKSGPEISVPFIAGLIDSDIGKHSGSMGCTFRSERFVADLVGLMNNLGIGAKQGGTYLIKEKYPQTDFKIPKREVKALKDVLSQNYLPKRIDRLETIDSLLQGYGSGQTSRI